MKRKTIILALVALFASFNLLVGQDQNNFEISKNIEIYVDVLRQLNQNYADNINPGDLNKAAIDAMLAKLDPYTVYVPESQIEDFELMTKGEYGGIGALIQKQGDYILISEPYEGFPAAKTGLRAGDKIIAIDKESAKGKNTSAISDKLKGIPGTSLVLTVQSYGDTTTRDVVIVREKVKIPNIPYYGMLDKGIGYISLIQFNPNAANEIKKAISDLKEKNELKGLILDLRGNGGGLLSEAVDIVNIFVPKGTTVVTTKGKLSGSVQVHRTRLAAVDTKLPLVVLVDENSASASEIVAGAIQDLDRGVVIGNRTFGKGLVQNIVPLPYNSKMKITIAKYYIPSGRCIQAIDYFDGDKSRRPDKIPDSLISEFKTAGGRLVYDGGGIEPDINMDQRVFSQITSDLYAQSYIFNFTNDYVLSHDSIDSPSTFIIDDETYDNFIKYVSDKDFSYNTETESMIEQIQKSASREGYLDVMQPLLDSLNVVIREEKLNDIEKYRKEIEELLKIEIVSRYYYQTGKVIASLSDDPEILESIDLLSDKALYTSILDGTYASNK